VLPAAILTTWNCFLAARWIGHSIIQNRDWVRCGDIWNSAAVTPQLRPETQADHNTIYDLTQQAFAPMPYSDGDEQDLINKLRDHGALALSLVAQMDDRIVGHVAFSPAFAADGIPNWFALGPVSVLPELQGQGIGGLLIREGIKRLVEQNAAGITLVGNPNYYRRFGFVLSPDLAPTGQPKEYFMVLPMGCAEPTSVIAFHPLFGECH
jgi:putative acetyltransferase